MGVDVFLVVSGYFLVGRQLQEADFRLMDFLKKKALRLLVPYFAILVLVPLLSVLLFPSEVQLDGARLLRACQFMYGNVYLDSLSGNYFSTDTRAFPLMHLWYMGVLLQCYLLFTLLFMVWHYFRCGKGTRIFLVSLLALISLAVAYLRFTPIPWQYTNDMYYWSSARVWEFAMGGMLYILPKPKFRIAWRVAGGFSLALLLGASFIPVRENAWMILLGAVCGGVLLRSGALWESFSPLRASWLVWLGTISFSLYLLHWPCICFAEFVLGQRISYVTALPVCMLVLLLAWLFYRLVEKAHAPMWILPLLLVGSGFLHKAICITEGFHDQLHQQTNQAMKVINKELPTLQSLASSSPLYDGAEGIVPNNSTPKPNPDTAWLMQVGATSSAPNFVIIGDSHAADFAVGMHVLAQQHGWHGLFLNSYVTPFWNSELRANPFVAIGNFCNEDKIRRFMGWLEYHPELRTVFIAQYWNSRFTPHFSWAGKEVTGDMVQVRAAELREFCRRLKSLGRKVVLLTDIPTVATYTPRRSVCSYLTFHPWKEYPEDLLCRKADYDRDNAAFNHEMDKLAQEDLCIVLHRENSFFEEDVFHAFDGRCISHRDKHHLTTEGVLLSLSGIMDQLREILDEQPEE